jgi:hypothetical protein
MNHFYGITFRLLKALIFQNKNRQKEKQALSYKPFSGNFSLLAIQLFFRRKG